MLPTITAYLVSIGCEMPEIRLLQPADPFLDTTGEDLRRRIFITSNNTGANLCLRPEFTIPVCLHHLNNGNSPARYAYGGTVFRQRTGAPAEFVQAGFEDLGDADTQKADANCIVTALELLSRAGVQDHSLVLGHQTIFAALLDALEIPAAWHQKLLRSFGDDLALRQQLKTLAGDVTEDAPKLPGSILRCLETGNDRELVDAVTDAMLADGLPLSGGRTPWAIAERIAEKHQLRATRLEPEKQKILENFLALDAPLEGAADALTGFARDRGLKLDQAIAPLAELAASLGKATGDGRYRASFGRRLDYYTGLVFEIFNPCSEKPLIGGGRYDRLLSLLGAKGEIPAVGFAVWIDRLASAQ